MIKKVTHLRFLSTTLVLLLGIGQQQIAIADTSKTECTQLGLSSCPIPFDKNLPDPKKMLTWDQKTRVVGFRNTYRMYAGDVFKTLGATPYPLPKAQYEIPQLSYILNGEKLGLKDYLKNQSVTGLLILKKGEIVYEYYGNGNTSETLWTSRSVAKSVVSVLVGSAIKEGLIHSVDDPIVRYIPELKGSAWEHVTLHQLMQHTSGVAWNENYADPKSDFSQMTLCEATTDPYQCVFNLVKSVPAKSKPGEVWSYNTGGAWLVGLVLERASGMTIAEYLQNRIWSRYGMEHDGVWHALVKNKVNMGGHGFNASLRDWGRFGLLVSRNGLLSPNEQILPQDWIKQSTTWTKAKGSVTSSAPNGQYGYQWWFNAIDPKENTSPKSTKTSDQTFWALGIFGQTIAINPAEELVVVQWSTWKQAEEPAYLYSEQAAFVNALSNALENK